MIDYFSTDIIHLHVLASKVLDSFLNLKKIGDSSYVPLWKGKVPEDQLVSEFWHILVKTFSTDNLKYNNCKAQIQYQHDSNNVIFETGILVTYITDYEKLKIEQHNKNLSH